MRIALLLLCPTVLALTGCASGQNWTTSPDSQAGEYGHTMNSAVFDGAQSATQQQENEGELQNRPLSPPQ